MHDKCLVNVLNGVYPNGEVDQMTSKGLFLFVDKLLEYLATLGLGAKSTKLKAINYNNDNIWRKKLIMKCVNFFSKCPVNEVHSLSAFRTGFNNKENIISNSNNNNDSTKWRGNSDSEIKNDSVVVVKKKRGRKRKYPFLKNLFVPLVRLPSLQLKKKEAKVKKIDKNDFLSYFSLKQTDVSTEKELDCFEKKYYPKNYRLISNPHIPFSSTLGRVLANKERYVMSEYLKIKRQERIEWYLSTSNTQIVDDTTEYPVTYVPPSTELSFCHVYKFGKRTNSEDLLTNCKPLSVRLKSIKVDQLSVKMKLCPDIAVNINRLSPKMVKDSNGGKRLNVNIEKVQCRRNLSIQLTDVAKKMKKKKL